MLEEPLADWQSWIISLAHFLSHSPGWFETFSSLLKPQISLPTAFPARVLASYLIKNLHELSSPTLSTVLHVYLHVLPVLLLLRSSPQPIFRLRTKSHIPSCPLKDSATAVPRCPHHSDPGTSILYLITAIGMLFLLLFKKKKIPWLHFPYSYRPLSLFPFIGKFVKRGIDTTCLQLFFSFSLYIHSSFLPSPQHLPNYLNCSLIPSATSTLLTQLSFYLTCNHLWAILHYQLLGKSFFIDLDDNTFAWFAMYFSGCPFAVSFAGFLLSPWAPSLLVHYSTGDLILSLSADGFQMHHLYSGDLKSCV